MVVFRLYPVLYRICRSYSYSLRMQWIKMYSMSFTWQYRVQFCELGLLHCSPMDGYMKPALNSCANKMNYMNESHSIVTFFKSFSCHAFYYFTHIRSGKDQKVSICTGFYAIYQKDFSRTHLKFHIVNSHHILDSSLIELDKNRWNKNAIIHFFLSKFTRKHNLFDVLTT